MKKLILFSFPSSLHLFGYALRVLLCLVFTSVLLTADAQINLDFGNLGSGTTQQTELETSGSISFTSPIANDGSTDIYAQILALTGYNESLDTGHADSGGVSDNIRINQRQGTQTRYRFSLYSDASLTTLYDPGVAYNYNLVFFDVDGNVDSGNTTIDEIIFYSQASLTYRTDTDLTIDTSNPAYAARVTGPTTPVAGGVEVTDLNDDQEKVAARFVIDSLNQVEFAYNVTGTAVADANNDLANDLFPDRNMFMDGGSLIFDNGTTTTVIVIPEPGTLVLTGILLSACGIVFGFRRKRR